MNYKLNEKWVAAGGAAWDFSKIGSIGQTFSLTRIGESALVQVGINVDSGRDNVSFNFNIEPRFLPRAASAPPAVNWYNPPLVRD